MILKKIIIPSAIWLSVLVHIIIAYQRIELSVPRPTHAPEPAFQMIDAVVVETPQPEVALDNSPPVEMHVEPAVLEAEVVEPLNVPVDSPPQDQPAPIEDTSAEVTDAVIVVEETAETEPETVSEETVVPRSSAAAEVAAGIPAEKRPTFLYQPELRYPQLAMRQRIEGAVIIDADIDENGTLIRTKVIEGAGFGFEEAAIELLENSDFSPAVIGGTPVAVTMRFTIEFRLD